MGNWGSPFYYRDADELPTPLNIPTKLRQNETASWQDDEYEDAGGNVYPSTTYGLTYVLAGPAVTPVQITAVPGGVAGTGWTTSITPAIGALLLPGTYAWQGVLTATNFRLVAGEGQLTVEVDLGALTGVYDPRTTAQKNLALYEGAAAALIGANGTPVKSYEIGTRKMTYQDLKEIQAAISYWRARVASEQDADDGGKSRRLLARWSRAH